MPDIVLHQWEISPFCGKVRRALQFKGLSYRVVNYNGLKALKAGRLSAPGKLPVMDFNGKRVVDSSAILRFLEDRFPKPPLVPTDEVGRAEMRIWEDWADESLFWFEVYFRFGEKEARKRSVELLCQGRPAPERWIFGAVTTAIYTKRLRSQGLGRRSSDDVRTELCGHLDALDTILAKRPFLLGDGATMADLAVAAQLYELARTSPVRSEIDSRPALAKWRKKLDQ